MSYGCPKCAKVNLSEQFSLTKKEFIVKSRNIHGEMYDYSLVDYKNYMTKVDIICSKHGIFKQTPNAHLQNQGCPLCRESKGEKRIRKYLSKRSVIFERQKKFSMCKFKEELPFDFYLPEKNMLIEYDGRQHFEPINVFGGQMGLLETQRNDRIKNKFVEDNDISLLRINYKEYNKIEEILNLKI
jgi:very-short-patch-repair endonuclease